MASRSKADLHPKLVEAYNKAAAKWAVQYPHLSQPFITATFRSNEEQNALYAQGRTAKGRIVTNAKAGQSAHNYNPSFAFDIAFITAAKKLDWTNSLFRKFADLIKSEAGCVVTWGGDFRSLPDSPHFELTNWKSIIKSK